MENFSKKEISVTPFERISDSVEDCKIGQVGSTPFRLERFSALDGKVIYYLYPNNFEHKFAFTHIRDVIYFCRCYVNNHSNKFWFRLWDSLPLYKTSVVSKNRVTLAESLIYF